MTSTDLNADGFVQWSRFNLSSKSSLMDILPNGFGVYIIRTTKAIKRIRGESDVIYVGSACNEKGLKGGISQYFSPGPTQPTNKRILTLVGNCDDYEIGWCEVSLKSDAVGLEQRLLERYKADHGERPPENLKG